MIAINREEEMMTTTINIIVNLDFHEVGFMGTNVPTVNNLDILRAVIENNDICDAIVLKTPRTPQYDDASQIYFDLQ